MSKNQQVKKNIELSSELSQYMLENPSLAADMPSHSSYVVFSSKDKELNKLNEKLADKITKEGRQVVRAQKTGDEENPWTLTPLNP